MEQDLQSRQQIPCNEGSPEMIAFTLQKDQVLSERMLVRDLIELIKRTPDEKIEKQTFPRKQSDTPGLFNKKERLIMQRLIQQPVDDNRHGTVTHLQDLLGAYGDELTILDELSTRREKSHAILRQVYESSALDHQPWFDTQVELIKCVNNMVEKFSAMQITKLLSNRPALKHHWSRELILVRQEGQKQAKEDADIEKAIATFASSEWLETYLLAPYPAILSLIIQQHFTGEDKDLRQHIINIMKVNETTRVGSVAIQKGRDTEAARQSWNLLNQIKMSAATKYPHHRIEGVSSISYIYKAARENKFLFKNFLIRYNSTLIFRHCPLCNFVAPTAAQIHRHRRRRHPVRRQNQEPDQNNNYLEGRGV